MRLEHYVLAGPSLLREKARLPGPQGPAQVPIVAGEGMPRRDKPKPTCVDVPRQAVGWFTYSRWARSLDSDPPPGGGDQRRGAGGDNLRGCDLPVTRSNINMQGGSSDARCAPGRTARQLARYAVR